MVEPTETTEERNYRLAQQACADENGSFTEREERLKVTKAALDAVTPGTPAIDTSPEEVEKEAAWLSDYKPEARRLSYISSMLRSLSQENQTLKANYKWLEKQNGKWTDSCVAAEKEVVRLKARVEELEEETFNLASERGVLMADLNISHGIYRGLTEEVASLKGALEEADTTALSIDVSVMGPCHGDERQKIRNVHHICDQALRPKKDK